MEKSKWTNKMNEKEKKEIEKKKKVERKNSKKWKIKRNNLCKRTETNKERKINLCQMRNEKEDTNKMTT